MIPPKWLSWALLAVLCWGFWAISIRFVGNALTEGQSQALSTIGVLPVLAVLLKSARSPHKKGIGAAFAAGAVVCLGNVAYYYALKIGGSAASVVSITALYPLVTIVLALVFLKERLNGVQKVGVLLSLISIVIFNILSTKGFLTGWLAYALVPVLLWGVGGLLQKISTNGISGECSTFWFLAAFVPVAIVLLIAEPPRAAPSGRVWALVGAVGFLIGLGNLAILFAFARAGKASIIAPLAALYPAVSIPIAILFLGDKVSAREWLGIVLALVSVVALAWEGKKTARDI